MDAKLSELISTRSKLGDSLSQISQLTKLTIEQVKETLGQATGLTVEELSIIYIMKQEGRCLEQISQEVQVALEVLKLFLPQDSPETDDYHIPAEKRPSNRLQFIYCCKFGTDQLLRTNLLTGEQSYHQLHDFRFYGLCRWRELPDGSLVITGGYEDTIGVKEAVKIDTLRECAVCSLPPMHTARYSHAAEYHSQYLYVLGGYNGSYLTECERYVCSQSRWEVLPGLPVACCAMSAVVLDNSLYALGGNNAKP
jgi:hypothetical protein